MPDFDILPDNVGESYRFFAASLSSWIVGTVFLPIPMALAFAFILSIIYRNENERLKQLLLQAQDFHLANISDLKTNDQMFFICCWPEALIEILKSETLDGDKIKLKIRSNYIKFELFLVYFLELFVLGIVCSATIYATLTYS